MTRSGVGYRTTPTPDRAAAVPEEPRTSARPETADKPAVVVAGDALVDLSPTRTADGAAAFQPCPGGSRLNVAAGLGRLGVPAALRREAGRRLVSLDPNVRPGLVTDRAVCLRRLASGGRWPTW